MVAQKSIVPLGLVICLFLPGCTTKPATSQIPEPPDSAEPLEVPGDFAIEASYSPGYSPWPGWDSTIRVDGSVTQKTWGARGSFPDSSNQIRLTKVDMELLWNRVKDAKFFRLKEEYKAHATDMATLTLEVTRNKMTHKVSVYGFDEIKDQTERSHVGRFLTIWSEVLRLVPSPNPKQTAEMYKLQ